MTDKNEEWDWHEFNPPQLVNAYGDIAPCPECGRMPYFTQESFPNADGPMYFSHSCPFKGSPIERSKTIEDAVSKWNSSVYKYVNVYYPRLEAKSRATKCPKCGRQKIVRKRFSLDYCKCGELVRKPDTKFDDPDPKDFENVRRWVERYEGVAKAV